MGNMESAIKSTLQNFSTSVTNCSSRQGRRLQERMPNWHKVLAEKDSLPTHRDL